MSKFEDMYGIPAPVHPDQQRILEDVAKLFPKGPTVDEVLKDYRDLLLGIMNSRIGHAPHLVYCDNLFRVDRIKKMYDRLNAVSQQKTKSKAFK